MARGHLASAASGGSVSALARDVAGVLSSRGDTTERHRPVEPRHGTRGESEVLMAEALASALGLAHQRRDTTLSELNDFLRIPSVSGDPSRSDDVARAADWLAVRLGALGAGRVSVFPTDGHPLVYGEIVRAADAAPTVLLYGHYDVQPASALDDWETDPFEPEIRGDGLRARGASDNKGPMIACIAAVEAALSSGSMPVNVKFLFEGEEEIGSTHFRRFLQDHRDLCACDLVLNPDVGMLDEQSPTVYYGLRGMYRAYLRVTGPSRDLHSGGYGGVVRNPIHALAEIIAGMHDDDGRVTLPGFYDAVRPLSAEERSEMASLPRDDASYLRDSGVPGLWGEPGFIAAEREGARPALDVIHTSAGSEKAAIPADATAIVTVRLVPDQDPDDVHAQLQSYIQGRAPATVRWEIADWGGFPASLTDRDAPGVRAMARAMRETWGRDPVFYRSGGSIAAVGFLREVLGVDSILTGFSLPGDRVHGPNERLHVPTWERGIDAVIRFLYRLPDEPAS
jgi:acetylornithine deacetylase/succinyl-diaminopimelate desuccinylase-like protein